MAFSPPVSDEELRRCIAVVSEHGGNKTAASFALDIPRGTLDGRLREAKRRFGDHQHASSRQDPAAHHQAQPLAPRRAADELVVQPGPESDEPIEELVARRRKAFGRVKAADDFASLIPVAVKTTQPICLVHIGDPHVDDDGCDIGQLEDDLKVIRATEGMFACHLGDITNNWVGRLGRLYANQSTSAKEGVRLAQWIFESAPTLYTVMGNHDCWQDSDFLAYMCRAAGATVQPHGVRINLTWPDGKSVRVHARHDFPGRSQYNGAHGMRRETLFGFRDHLLLAGHTHEDAAMAVPAVDGTVHWMFRVSGYKVIDDYAEANRFLPKRMGPSVATIIDPHAARPVEIVKPFWDLAEAADYLTFKRARMKK